MEAICKGLMASHVLWRIFKSKGNEADKSLREKEKVKKVKL